MVERCRRVEPKRTPRNQLRRREEEGPVGWRLRYCKRAALVAKAAGQQQEGAIGRARPSELQESEVILARGRRGWSEIRSSDCKHSHLRKSVSLDLTWRNRLCFSMIGSSCEGVETEVNGHNAVGVPAVSLAAIGVRMVVEAAVADGTVERGRRIDPSKDDDERAQEGAACGKWGGAAGNVLWFGEKSVLTVESGLEDDVAMVGNQEKGRPLSWEGAMRVTV
ncbi:hypothetical protein BHM03_00028681 [Ensete ventricosum]|nr:hypothetical protein BHM03_00028681 [Ensete ventricosum]